MASSFQETTYLISICFSMLSLLLSFSKVFLRTYEFALISLVATFKILSTRPPSSSIGSCPGELMLNAFDGGNKCDCFEARFALYGAFGVELKT